MGSAKRLLFPGRKITRPVLRKRLAGFISRFTRAGRNIRLSQEGSDLSSGAEKILLREYHNAMLELRRKGRADSKIKKLRARSRAIVIALHLRGELKKKPSVFQLLAVEALAKGLNAPSLRELASAMTSMYKAGINVPWVGTGTDIAKAIHYRVPGTTYYLPAAIERTLRDNIRSDFAPVMSSREIAQELGMAWTHLNMSRINYAMQLLETCRLVQRMPYLSGKAPLSMWVHAQDLPPKVAYANVGIELLTKLSSGTQEISQLYRFREVSTGSGGRVKIGSKGAHYNNGIVQQQLARFVELGLVTQSESVKNDARGVRHRIARYALSESGKKLFDYYLRAGHLIRPLRQALIG